MLACDNISKTNINSTGMVKRFKKKVEVRIICGTPVMGIS